MQPILSAILIGLAVFFALSTGHFFPWHVLGSHLTDEYGHLRRVPSYIYGVSIIGIGLTVWLNINDRNEMITWAFWFFAACAGTGTAGGYMVDRLIERRANHNHDRRDNGTTDE